ncbi:MAG: hypothetical protein WCT31_01500 [Candidatus Micrarchaeia archaeon]
MLDFLKRTSHSSEFQLNPKDFDPAYWKSYIAREGGPVLPVQELYVSERCFRNCSYCSNVSVPTGPMMPFSLVTTAFASDGLIPYSNIVLGDGEPLIYQDKQLGKNLLDILNFLLCDLNLQVSFTTAGLLPVNQKIGTPVLEGLDQLGNDALSRLRLFISFNESHGMDPREYFGCMEETFRLVAGVRSVKAQIRAMPPDFEGEQGRLSLVLKQYQQRFGVPHVISNGCMELHIGRPAMSTKPSIFPAFYDATDCDATKHSDRPVFGLRADGKVCVSCLRSGSRGYDLGNVYDNSPIQIFQAHQQFIKEQSSRLIWSPMNLNPCEWHRRWNKSFGLPPSAKPIMNRREHLVRV